MLQRWWRKYSEGFAEQPECRAKRSDASQRAWGRRRAWSKAAGGARVRRTFPTTAGRTGWHTQADDAVKPSPNSSGMKECDGEQQQ